MTPGQRRISATVSRCAPGKAATTSASSALTAASVPVTSAPRAALPSAATTFSVQSTLPRLTDAPIKLLHSGSIARSSSGILNESSRKRWLTLRISQTTRNGGIVSSAVENPVML